MAPLRQREWIIPPRCRTTHDQVLHLLTAYSNCSALTFTFIVWLLLLLLLLLLLHQLLDA